MSDVIRDGKKRSRFLIFIGTEGAVRVGGTTDLYDADLKAAIKGGAVEIIAGVEYIVLNSLPARNPKTGEEEPGETMYFRRADITAFVTCDISEKVIHVLKGN